jgi:hypothetical protein
MSEFTKSQATGREHTRVPAADDRSCHISVRRGRISVGHMVFELSQIDELRKALAEAELIATEQVATTEAKTPAEVQAKLIEMGNHLRAAGQM